MGPWGPGGPWNQRGKRVRPISGGGRRAHSGPPPASFQNKPESLPAPSTLPSHSGQNGWTCQVGPAGVGMRALPSPTGKARPQGCVRMGEDRAGSPFWTGRGGSPAHPAGDAGGAEGTAGTHLASLLSRRAFFARVPLSGKRRLALVSGLWESRPGHAPASQTEGQSPGPSHFLPAPPHSGLVTPSPLAPTSAASSVKWE